MGLFDRFFTTKDSATLVSVIPNFGEGLEFFKRISSHSLISEGYESNVTAFACIDAISTAIADIPWVVRRTSGKDEIDILPSDSGKAGKLAQIVSIPNVDQGWSDFLEALVSHLYINGSAYIEAVGPKGGPNRGMPLELHVPEAQYIDPKFDQAGKLRGYEFKRGSFQKLFVPEEMLQLRFFNPHNRVNGLSRVAVAARGINMDNAAAEWNVSLLKNGGRIGGFLISKTPLNDKQINQIEKVYADRYQGAGNAGRPMVLAAENGIDFKEAAFAPKDMDWTTGRQVATKDICKAFGVPPEIVGDQDNRTYNSYGEARKAFYQETVVPLANKIVGRLNVWLTPKFDVSAKLCVCVEDIPALQEDQETRRSFALRAWDSGAFTLNQFYSWIGEEIVPDGALRKVTVGSQFTEDLQVFKEEQEARSEEMRDNFSKIGSSSDDDDDEDGDEAKAFIFGADSLQLYWKTFDQARFGWTDKYATTFEGFLLDELDRVDRVLKQSGSLIAGRQNVERILDERKETLETVFNDLYFQVGIDFAARVDERFILTRSASTFETKARTVEDWQDFISTYIGNVTRSKITQMNTTTKKLILEQLAEGAAQGEGIPEISKRIKQFVEPGVKNRAAMIAQTEVISASNAGSRAAAIATGLRLQKRWLATPDERTRGIHASADGQKTDMNSAYYVSGEPLLFPGDTSLGASAKNVIQCRCTEVYEPVDGDEISG